MAKYKAWIEIEFDTCGTPSIGQPVRDTIKNVLTNDPPSLKILDAGIEVVKPPEVLLADRVCKAYGDDGLALRTILIMEAKKLLAEVLKDGGTQS